MTNRFEAIYATHSAGGSALLHLEDPEIKPGLATDIPEPEPPEDDDDLDADAAAEQGD